MLMSTFFFLRRGKSPTLEAKLLLLSLVVAALTLSSSQAVQYPTSSQTLPYRSPSQKSKSSSPYLSKTPTSAQHSSSSSSSSLSRPFRGGSSSTETGSTITASVFNLVNNVAGAGILTLAAGKAKGSGWIPSILLCTGLGIISSHTFTMIGQDCELTGEADFKGLWGRSIGKESTYIVDTLIAVLCLACAVIYSGILGDVFTPLLSSVGVPDALNGRTSNILAITISCLFPLSLIKDLSALAFTSILGFSAIAYTLVFIVIRALDGTYSIGDVVGKFIQDDVIAKPSFEKSTLWKFDFSSLVLTSNLGLAYIAHYNGPTFYRSLQNTNSARFSLMVRISFFILTCLYISIMCAGYATFGDITEGNILLNYHPADVLSTMARLATGFSILFGFPLVITGARESILGAASSLGMPSLSESKYHVSVVLAILSLVTAISTLVKDVSVVVGLTGAILGSFIVYICPTLIHIKTVALCKGKESLEYKRARLNYVWVPFGLVIAGLGAFMTLKEAGLI